MTERSPSDRLAAFVPWADDAVVSVIDVGLINQTFLVKGPASDFVLQRVNPMFGREVHEDIEAVTRHLEEKGLETPRLVRSRDGELSTIAEDGACWRLFTFVPGHVARSAGAATLRSCGQLVARFHSALADLPHEFRFVRGGAHDTPKHLRYLQETRDGGWRQSEEDEPSLSEVHRVADEIRRAGEGLADLQSITPPRVIHGDLKLTNIMLREGEAVAVLDLDTMSRGSLAVELGDALRSWCNALGEDQGEAHLDLERFTAAMSGYGEHARVSLAERETIVLGFLTITTELAARFCADAYRESYFGWNRERFGSARAHNLLRARVQLSLAKQVVAQRAALEAVVADKLIT